MNFSHKPGRDKQMESIIEEIKQNVMIIEALEEYTTAKMEKAPIHKKSFNICCPFHNDRNPSFTVYNESNRWICHSGCGYGDVIDLVAKANQIQVNEAIKLLATDLGIETTFSSRLQTEEYYEKIKRIKRAIKDFNEHCIFYAEQLISFERYIRDTAKSISNTLELAQKGDIYHRSPWIEYLFELLESDQVSDKIYAIKQIEGLMNDEKFKIEQPH
jgi:hypothetical protein